MVYLAQRYIVETYLFYASLNGTHADNSNVTQRHTMT